MLSKAALAIALLGGVGGCYVMRGSQGGGEVEQGERRTPNPAHVALSDGYSLDVAAVGLTYPTDVAFDDAGRLHVVESGYSYGEHFTRARLLRFDEGGRWTTVAEGTNGPWTGAVFHGGGFYVSEGGVREGGRIVFISPDGSRSVLVEGLPSYGDHHTNRPVLGPDGFLYFGQGVATNSGIVGEDSKDYGWLPRFPKHSDVPCKDIALTGKNYETRDVLRNSEARVLTGAFVPFGTKTEPDQVIPGRVPCTGAVLRVHPESRALELVAWGLRNPFGLAFDARGRLYATDNGADERGSRPIFGAADVLWKIDAGAWYGWPDYTEGRPVDQERYAPPGGERPARLLAKHPGTPPKPVAYLPVHASVDGIDISKNASFGFVGQAFVAVFGDMAPKVGKVLGPVGFSVIRVDLESGASFDFALNRSEEPGPASLVGGGGFERPLAVRFDPSGTSLYVVDFGVVEMSETAIRSKPGTGVVWRIRRTGGSP